MVVAIPPRVAVATFIGQVKAVASTRYNKLHTPPFFWQAEYGAFSFDGKRLPNYIAYVERQKQHHQQATTIPILERTSEGMPKMMREMDSFYVIDDDKWRQELEELDRFSSGQ